MLSEKDIFRVVITGPESTGKTELAQALAQRFETSWIPEYARTYVENLGRPYDYDDVIRIAQYQIIQEQEFAQGNEKKIVFFDTWLIITKVWLDLVYGKCPEWIKEHIGSTKIDLFLVCNTDLPWIFDPVRENGGDKREQLFQIYIDEISSFGFNYEIVEGFGQQRTENALIALSRHGFEPGGSLVC